MKRFERSVGRIEPLMAELQAFWLRNPNQRLAQLLVNLIASHEPCPEVFYFEDDELLRRLRQAAGKVDGAGNGPPVP